jgi:hypothetical protein
VTSCERTIVAEKVADDLLELLVQESAERVATAQDATVGDDVKELVDGLQQIRREIS